MSTNMGIVVSGAYAPPSSLNRHTGMPILRALSPRLAEMRETREDDDANGQGFEHLVVALEGRGVAVAVPVGLALQLAVPGGGVHRHGRCPQQHGHHRDRGGIRSRR